MTFLNKEIEDAYYASPLPLEGTLANDANYRRCLRQAAANHRKILDSLSPEAYELVKAYAMEFAEQADTEAMYYFQQGWLAARQNADSK